ncbi:hypothetical protein ABVT39_001694 [Epinephelus coioides]
MSQHGAVLCFKTNGGKSYKSRSVEEMFKSPLSGCADWNVLSSDCPASFSSLRLTKLIPNFEGNFQRDCFDETQTEVPQQLKCIQANDQSERITITLQKPAPRVNFGVLKSN